ncbi:hypothetical protein B0H63DRAFT_220690 [Podospora didyma]|uniref:Secreted protein n=1 Tax=Podospora didyma TaxID=330526 RepID=A0AAE0KK87_9PEZI|nr:hypothetical protein B0H63DRAFT_220690 [Podospora didyma]
MKVVCSGLTSSLLLVFSLRGFSTLPLSAACPVDVPGSSSLRLGLCHPPLLGFWLPLPVNCCAQTLLRLCKCLSPLVSNTTELPACDDEGPQAPISSSVELAGVLGSKLVLLVDPRPDGLIDNSFPTGRSGWERGLWLGWLAAVRCSGVSLTSTCFDLVRVDP